ncbi:MAG: hypothetical protein Q4A33_02970, partial [Candidatus Saccharibacteria bacterium]|nr:hypothetical protein [Candidatus Saccharibacteria bacterium]
MAAGEKIFTGSQAAPINAPKDARQIIAPAPEAAELYSRGGIQPSLSADSGQFSSTAGFIYNGLPISEIKSGKEGNTFDVGHNGEEIMFDSTDAIPIGVNAQTVAQSEPITPPAADNFMPVSAAVPGTFKPTAEVAEQYKDVFGTASSNDDQIRIENTNPVVETKAQTGMIQEINSREGLHDYVKQKKAHESAVASYGYKPVTKPITSETAPAENKTLWSKLGNVARGVKGLFDRGEAQKKQANQKS